MELAPGLEAEITITVGEEDLATAFGNEGVPVFATPALLSYFESACRRLLFEVEAHDEVEKVGEGRHERYYLDAPKFLAKAEEKAGPL